MAITRKPSGAEDEALFLDQAWPEMPTVPESVQERFPEMRAYQQSMEGWWREMQLRLRELAARRRLLPDSLDGQ